MNHGTHGWLEQFGEARWHEPLARHTTMHIGGTADVVVFVYAREHMIRLLERLENERLPWRILGGGSNVIAANRHFAEVVIRPMFQSVRMSAMGRISAEAGCITALFARKVTEAGYAGWEWGVGLPGTLGGAIVGNAGCFGGETSDHLVEIEWWNATTCAVERLPSHEAGFAYRESRFKHERGCVLGAAWDLSPAADHDASLARMKSILEMRKTHQPLGAASAGCIFVNIPVTAEELHRVEMLTETRVPSPSRERGSIPAGWLIERAGLKGMTLGTARISDKHANFFLTSIDTRVEDILRLQLHVQRVVAQKFGLNLVPEARYWE